MSKNLRRIALILCSCMFLYSAFQLGKYYLEYRKGDQIYEEAKSFVISADVAQGAEIQKAPVIEFDKLKEINEDIFGWIRIEGTPVDYPLLKSDDNVYYLNHTYDKQYSSFGSIFLDKENQTDLLDRHTIIYGHNMKNKSMFGSLSSFQKQEFLTEHPTIHIYFPDGEMTYEIFSVYTAYVLDSTYTLSFTDDRAFQAMLNHMEEASVVSGNRKAQVGDKILTLSTCTPSGSVNNRFVINGILKEDTRPVAEQ